MAHPSTSTREQVAEMTARGLTPREIASLLRISTQAVYKHLTALEEEAAS